MKFKIRTSLLLGAALILCCLVLATSFKHKSKRAESMMEFMNNFFSGDTKAVPKETKSAANTDPLHKKHKKHSKGKKKSHFRFKESSRNENVKHRYAQDPAPINGPNLTNPSAIAVANATNITALNMSIPDVGSDLLKSDWFMISSPVFTDTRKFPPVVLPSGQKVQIKLDSEFFRMNEAFENEVEEEKGPSNKFFWFRLSGLNIYYSLTKSDMNVLGAISVRHVSRISKSELTLVGYSKSYCFTVQDRERNDWKLCSLTEEISKSWVCTLKKFLNDIEDPFCQEHSTPSNQTIIERNITQPIIIIPVPSPMCNENWDYQQYGVDWKCDCEEGREQSPIDLPAENEAIDSPVKPIFQYEEVAATSKISTIDGQLKQNEPLKLKMKDHALRIFHDKFGKVVTMDGGVYYAQEIVVHTPAEHTINGKTYDMELQIIHYGQSKGDIAKQIILSFVFERTPGVYNKFIDDLDIFNLPNPLSMERDLLSNIYIPKIFYSADDSDIPVMHPFSFYTYQGSLTAPPCSENTIMYVASKPIPLGSTAMQLFKEALRVPDVINQSGDVFVSNWKPVSNRKLQPRNGRPVFHYNHEKQCGVDPARNPPKPKGHYEKYTKALTNYFYVNGNDPSGLPNAFVVSEAEALGKPIKNLSDA